MADVESRLQTLQWLYGVTKAAIEEAPVDKKSPLIAQLRAIVVEIADLGGEEPAEVERNGLIDFQSALAERKPGATGTRRASR